MNNKIKELAKDYLIKCEYTEFGWQEVDDTRYEFDQEDLEKFVKMIINECISVSDELKSDYLKNRKNETDFDVKQIYAEGETACDTLKHRMKKRFGV